MCYEYTAKTKPGMSDPYWYEWSIGEMYLLEMLYDDSDIESVAFQSNISLGLDDVVIYYKDGGIKCMQVKHSRADETLTFASLVSPKEEGKASILSELAESWYKEKDNYKEIIPQIVTNRKIGKKKSTTKTKVKFKRPPLKDFWTLLKDQLQAENIGFSDISFEGYDEAWNEWKEQIKVIPDDKDKINFLKLLELETEQPDLKLIEKKLVEEIVKIFGVSNDIAYSLFIKMDQKMRYWTSSIRESEKIKPEDVWEAMATEIPKRSYNHDLCPCEPFFKSRLDVIDKIEEELSRGKQQVVFLRGLPGMGKTNIISKLSNKRDSLIKIRYYAYEPVQPEKEYLPVDVSERVKKDIFWNELFNQLRTLLKGNLKKYNVPLQNDFMTLEEMKKRFFEIASRYAIEEGITFVVAIDGIDHAARAGVGVETFLNTLPNPIYIPQNVKLLIAGQPEDGYAEYPRWIKEECEGVKKIEVPGIMNEDILMLVSNKITEDRKAEYAAIVDVIERIAKGNTLSAIFAVYEASMCSNVLELERRLTDRKLHINVEEYYSNIWENAVRKINSYGFVDYKIAGMLALFNEKLDGHILTNVFSEENISQRSWKDILETLKPLVVEENDKYRLFHNDVKVFLAKIINQSNRVKYISDVIASYYIRTKNKSKVYYYDICKFLRMAERKNEIIKIFSPRFIIEAYVNGVSLETLSVYASEILRELLCVKDIDWNSMVNLSASWNTINQIRNTEYEIENYVFIEKNENIPYSEYECNVTEIRQWDAELISDVLDKIMMLYEVDIKRAREMFSHWFSDLTILYIWNSIYNKGMLEERFRDKHILLTETAKRIANNLGCLICRFKEYGMLEDVKDDENYFTFRGHLGTAFFKEAVLIYSGEELEESLNSNYVVYREVLLECCLQCIKYCRYDDLGIIEKAIRKRKSANKTFKLLDIFMRIVSGNIGFPDKFDRVKILDEIIEIEFLNYRYEYKSIYYCVYSFVIGYLNTSVDSVINARRVLDIYVKNNSRCKQKYYGMMFNLMCLLGNWLFQLRNEEHILLDKKQMVALLEGIFIKRHQPLEEDYGIRNHYSEILISIINCMEKSDLELRKSVEECLNKIFANYPVDQRIDAGWYLYRNNKKKIKEGVEYWINDKGEIWEQAIGDRNRMAFNFIRLAKQYHLYEYLNLQDFVDKVKWSVIGYASRKEYAFDNIMKWYVAVSELSAENVDCYAHEIKKLSDKVEEFGDNRLFHNINCKVYGDIFSCGIDQIKKLLNNDVYFQEMIRNPEYIVEGLVGLLKENNFSEEQLLLTWTFGIGMLDWKNEGNYSSIAGLKHAIFRNAEQNGIDITEENLKEIGQAEVYCYNDPVRFSIPNRWCEGKQSNGNTREKCIEVLEQYLTSVKGTAKETEVTNCIEFLARENVKKNSDYFIKVYDKYMSEERYEWYRSSLVQCCVENLPTQLADNLIRERLLCGLNGGIEYFYPYSELEAVCRWKIGALGVNYAVYGLKQYLNMQKEWLNSGGHINISIKVCERDEDILRSREFIDVESINSLEMLYVRLLLLVILSKDADRVETALRALYHLIKLRPELLNIIDSYWEQFHFRAKEWYLMILELLIDDGICIDDIQNILCKHINVKEFNAAIYIRLLIQKINEIIGNEEELPELIEQPFFEHIHNGGSRKIIKYKNNSRAVYGTQYVMSVIKRLNSITMCGGDSLEERVVDYASKINKLDFSIYNVGKNPQLGVVVDRESIALFDTIYKDFYYGRWNFEITNMMQCILSASEPYILLNSAPKFPYNEGKFFGEKKNKFIEKVDDEKKQLICQLLELGINENEETVLGGVIVDYVGEKEIDGFLYSYLNFPNVNSKIAQGSGHLNGRNILINNSDFFENYCCNIIVFNGGTASFNQSQKICDISYHALQSFRWKMIVDNGIYVVNEKNEKVIRLEIFSGERDIGNNYYCLQPIMQRWIIKNSEYEKIQDLCGNTEIKKTAFVEISSAQ